MPLRWVLIRDPQQKFATRAFLCTDVHATPDQILAWFVQRWQLEVTFEEARRHLGLETQRDWQSCSDRGLRVASPGSPRELMSQYWALTPRIQSQLDKSGVAGDAA